MRKAKRPVCKLEKKVRYIIFNILGKKGISIKKITNKNNSFPYSFQNSYKLL